MALINLTELAARLGPGERLLGIDPGRRRIGLALSDVNRSVASPFGTVPRGKLGSFAEAVRAIAAREDVGALVIGLPLGPDGAFVPAAQAARDWGRDLAALVALPAMMWDETLTTAEATAFLVERADLGRTRRAAVMDRVSAAAILQAALDALHDR